MKFKYLGSLPKFELYSFFVVNISSGGTRLDYSGSQAPTPQLMDDRLRIWFSARDRENRSNAFYYDVSLDDPLNVIGQANKPQIPLGPPGSPHEHGVMPSCVVGDAMYFAGWENPKRDDVRYRTTCMWYRFKDKKVGLLKDRDSEFMFGSSMPFMCLDDYFNFYIMGYKGWEASEPMYSIFEFDSANDSVCQILNISGKSIARPTMLDNKVIVSIRHNHDYRNNSDKMYRMFFFQPNDSFNNGYITIEGDNNPMQCYGYPVTIDNKTYLLYNSGGGPEGFTSPIRVAELCQ